MYPIRTHNPAEFQAQLESLVVAIALIVIFVVIMHWLYSSHMIWFWIVATLTASVCLFEGWRCYKNTRHKLIDN